MKRRFCYLVYILHRIVVCRTSLFSFPLSASCASFLFHVVLRSSTTSFIRVGLLFAELLFDFYAVRRYPVVIPLTAAGSLGAIRARGPSWGLNSGIRASVALVRSLLSNHRCCEPLPSFFAWSFFSAEVEAEFGSLGSPNGESLLKLELWVEPGSRRSPGGAFLGIVDRARLS